eukprot:14983607-Alexandrium_andersonii.AAC.1
MHCVAALASKLADLRVLLLAGAALDDAPLGVDVRRRCCREEQVFGLPLSQRAQLQAQPHQDCQPAVPPPVQARPGVLPAEPAGHPHMDILLGEGFGGRQVVPKPSEEVLVEQVVVAIANVLEDRRQEGFPQGVSPVRRLVVGLGRLLCLGPPSVALERAHVHVH